MLNAMRKQASSWTVKVLLGVLIVSFAVWGIGDLFLGGGNREIVAEVGSLDVDLADVNRTFEQSYRQLNASLGGAIDRQSAMAFGLLDQALQSQIAERLVDMHAADLGIGVADQQVRDAIQNEPAFRGAGGFDRQTMEFLLRSQGISEQDFVDGIRDEIRRRAVLASLTGTAPVSQTLARTLATYRNEQRQATVVIVDADRVIIEDPDEAALQEFLDENQSDFEAPEYRSGVVVTIEPEELAKDIEIDDARLREAYEGRLAEFTTDETRELGQLLAPDRETADEISASLAEEGADFAGIADSFSEKGVSYSTIGPVAQSDLPQTLGQAAFSVGLDQFSEAVESDFGWHIFKPVAINEGSQIPFDDVRDQIAQDLAVFEARGLVPDLGASLDEEIGAGETLEAAADTLGLELKTIAFVSRDGLFKDGPVDGYVPSTAVLTALFQGAMGEESLLEETPAGGYFVYRVDEIEDTRPLTLEEAHDEVLAEWQDKAKREAAREKAQLILDQAKEGRDPQSLADADEALELLTTGYLRRFENGAAYSLSRAAVATLFETGAQEFASDVVEVPSGYAVIRNDEILSSEDEIDTTTIEQEIAQARRSEMLAEYENHLRARYPVSVNEAALQYFYQEPGAQPGY